MRSVVKIAVLAIAVMASVGSAGAITAGEMLSKCRDVVNATRWNSSGKMRINFEENLDSMFCWGAFEGIQGIIFLKSIRGDNTMSMCIPGNVSRWQLVKVFEVFANDNPQLLHFDATIVAVGAIERAFPCEASEDVGK